MATPKEEVIGDIETLLGQLLKIEKTPTELESMGFTVDQVQSAVQKYAQDKIGGHYITWVMDYFVEKEKEKRLDPPNVSTDDIEDDFVIVSAGGISDSLASSSRFTSGGLPDKKK